MDARGGEAAAVVAHATASDARGDARLCVICLSQPKTHALLDCGHKCVCPDCARFFVAKGQEQARLERCPLCQAAVAGAIRVWD